MTCNDPQVPWTDEQWARVNNAIQEEASRARVAATFLPLVGPLSADTDFVRAETILNQPPLRIDDRNTIQLATLQARVLLRGAQMADPELTSALSLFRRAANMLARLEDAVVFNGLIPDPAIGAAPGIFPPPAAGRESVPRQGAPPRGAPLPMGAARGLQSMWEITGGQQYDGLYQAAARRNQFVPIGLIPPGVGGRLVGAVSGAIGQLEALGQFGPFAVVLGEVLFNFAQTPDRRSLVLPQDRIIPFLGGGSLLRSSTLLPPRGVVVALGAAPVELIVAADMSLQCLQITTDPVFLFRVFERIALRIKDTNAIIALR
jgi:uncharacterized linocin/CFP29 family protein